MASRSTYGATGTTNLTRIAQFLAENTLLHDGVLLVGLVFLLVGLGFKVAAAPFHMWTPDVYEGAPTPVTAFMAAATKAAAFAALLRVFVGAFDTYRVDWRPAVWVLAVISLLVGSIAAVVQTDVKRMLAYQSISHAGYVLIGVQVATAKGTSAALFYVCAYAVMAIGAFTVVTVVAREGDDRHSLEEYRGLARRRPVLAALFTLFLLAQAGVPLTGGFIAKLSVFDAAVDAGQYWLALIGMLAAVIGAFIYLRIVLAMFAPSADEEAPAGPRIRVDRGTGLALVDRGRRDPVPGHRSRHRPRLRPRRDATPRAIVGDEPEVRRRAAWSGVRPHASCSFDRQSTDRTSSRGLPLEHPCVERVTRLGGRESGGCVLPSSSSQWDSRDGARGRRR